MHVKEIVISKAYVREIVISKAHVREIVISKAYFERNRDIKGICEGNRDIKGIFVMIIMIEIYAYTDYKRTTMICDISISLQNHES